MNIELKGINYAYPESEKCALKNIDLKIKQGEFVLLAGTSGCGKTTVTRILNGLIPGFYGGKLEGSVLLDGRDIGEYKSYELASRMGSVFQNPRTQFFNVDTDSEITFGLENAGIPGTEINATLERITKELDLERLRGRDIFKLSGGEKQKIAVASVYASDPEVYLMDEPSANLDTVGISELRKALERIKGNGKTVIVAEHRLYYLAKMVDRVLYLKDGAIEKEFSGDEFRSMDLETLNSMGLRTNCHIKTTDRHFENCVLDDDADLLIKDLSVDFDGQRILNHLNVGFKKGRIYCVTGKNGEGKSTLLRTLCGLVKKSEGSVFLNGKEASPKELKKKVFMVMQDVNYQLFADSVLNECVLGTEKKDIETVEKNLEDMRLLEFQDRHPNTLSGGQKQRLAITVSLMMDKDILLFDEPTSGLDYGNMLICADSLKRLADMGKVIVVVTHDEEFIECCCGNIFNLTNA
ncbi:MAG: ABC transporter ATP-binding protein [Lachnospiraceae bacterium]|nr:ABC transporter ATP-binding protein [Lachnospiraceae bacterium]